MSDLNFTHLSDVVVDGLASSSMQGVFVGQTSTPLSELDVAAHDGCILLYTGATDAEWTNDCFYISDGETWRKLMLSNASVDGVVMSPGLVVVTDADGGLSVSGVTVDELAALSGVTGDLQGQIDALLSKADFEAAISSYYTKEEADSKLEETLADYYTKEEAQAVVEEALSGYYTKEEADSKLADALSSYYTKDETYTKEEVQALVEEALSPYCTKEEADSKLEEALSGYYTKDETYTKEEVQALVGAISSFDVLVVDALPEEGLEHTIYFVPSSNPVTDNTKDEFMWLSGAWEQIGSTEFRLVITQDADGVDVNGTALQHATAEQAGLMTAEQVSALDGAVSGVDSLGSRADALETAAASLEEAAEGLRTDVDALESRTDSLEESVASLGEGSDELKESVESLQAAMTTAQEGIDALDSEMETAQSDIDDLRNTVNILGGRVVTGGTGIDVTATGDEGSETVISLKDVEGVEGEYGSSVAFACVTVDAQGRVSSASSVEAYAPATAGDHGQYLASAGEGERPVWESAATSVEEDDASLVTGGAVHAALAAKQDVLLTFEATVPASAWTEGDGMWTADVEVEGMTADSVVWVTASPGSWDAWGDAGVRCTEQSDGVLTFGATSQPEEDLVAYLVIA